MDIQLKSKCYYTQERPETHFIDPRFRKVGNFLEYNFNTCIESYIVAEMYLGSMLIFFSHVSIMSMMQSIDKTEL